MEKNEFRIRSRLLEEIEDGIDLQHPDLFDKINYDLHRVDRQYQADQLKKEIITKLVFKRQMLIEQCEVEHIVINPRFTDENEIEDCYQITSGEPMPDISDLVEEISEIEEITNHIK